MPNVSTSLKSKLFWFFICITPILMKANTPCDTIVPVISITSAFTSDNSYNRYIVTFSSRPLLFTPPVKPLWKVPKFVLLITKLRKERHVDNIPSCFFADTYLKKICDFHGSSCSYKNDCRLKKPGTQDYLFSFYLNACPKTQSLKLKIIHLTPL